jgi:integrase
MRNPQLIENQDGSQNGGQEVGKSTSPATTTHGSFARLRQRIQRNTLKYFRRDAAPHYVIQMQRRKRREWFPLGEDLDAAVRMARQIDGYLRLHSWEATRNRFKPGFETELSDLTVGRYLEIVDQHGQLNPGTFYGYAARFRRIVSGIRSIGMRGADKYRGCAMPSKWRQEVDRVLLNSITPGQVSVWRDNYLAQRQGGSDDRVRAEHTVNGMLRNARALFAKRVLKRVLMKLPNLVLPSPLPFDGVELVPERESDFFYTPEIEAKQLIDDAFKELSGNQLIIFILAIGAGLRRNEIDKLPWTHVDLPTGTITVAPTKYSRLKSDSSVGKIQLEARFAEKLREHAIGASGEFVLPSPIPPRFDSSQRHYRCKKDFAALCDWLATKGMNRSTNRIHTLRKEFGSHVAERRGIFAASAGLRHSTIGVTRKYYVSSTVEPTAFFTPDEPAPPPADATQLVALMKLAMEQGLLKLPESKAI